MTTRWAAAKPDLWFSDFHTHTHKMDVFMFREKDGSLNSDPNWLCKFPEHFTVPTLWFSSNFLLSLAVRLPQYFKMPHHLLHGPHNFETEFSVANFYPVQEIHQVTLFKSNRCTSSFTNSVMFDLLLPDLITSLFK